MDSSKLRKLIEAINTYYAFALAFYAAVLFLASHTRLFTLVLIAATPLLAAWTGYLLKSYYECRTQRHGFKVLSDNMTYEIERNNKSTLRFSTRVKAGRDHLMVYPIGYQWTGNGSEAIPQVSSPGHQLLSQSRHANRKGNQAEPAPYILTNSTEGDWHYWFIALNPTLHKGEETEIVYSQDFYDKEGVAKPCLYYFVRTPLKKLELNVKFPKGGLPAAVNCSYVKSSDSRRPYPATGVDYDPNKQWATWVIDQPKKATATVLLGNKPKRLVKLADKNVIAKLL